MELIADPAWQRIDFISDLHLAADTPHTFAAWAAYMQATAADAVFILGDLFEVWVGDDARSDGFDARCAEVLSAATQQRSVAFMVGNRDFLVGSEMLATCGVKALTDPTLLTALGQRLLLSHGDALCLADVEYQQFRALVRSHAWQANFLAQPLAARRAFAREVRGKSEMRKRDQPDAAAWVDIDKPTALEWLGRANASTLIHGHTHRPACEALAEGCTREVLSDWDLDHAPHRAEVLRLTLSGLARLPLKEAQR